MGAGKTHLTPVNAQTTLSAKGQVVIPSDVRARLKLAPGDRLEVVERTDGVLLRKVARKSGDSFDAITARIRERIGDRGPAIPVEAMDDAIAAMWAAGGPRWDE